MSKIQIQKIVTVLLKASMRAKEKKGTALNKINIERNRSNHYHIPKETIRRLGERDANRYLAEPQRIKAVSPTNPTKTTVPKDFQMVKIVEPPYPYNDPRMQARLNAFYKRSNQNFLEKTLNSIVRRAYAGEFSDSYCYSHPVRLLNKPKNHFFDTILPIRTMRRDMAEMPIIINHDTIIKGRSRDYLTPCIVNDDYSNQVRQNRYFFQHSLSFASHTDKLFYSSSPLYFSQEARTMFQGTVNPSGRNNLYFGANIEPIISPLPHNDTGFWRSTGRWLGRQVLRAGTYGISKMQLWAVNHPEETTAIKTYLSTKSEFDTTLMLGIGIKLGADPERLVESMVRVNETFAEAGQQLGQLCDEYGLNKEDKACILSFSGLLLGVATKKGLIKAGKGGDKIERPHVLNPHQQYHIPPKNLNGFSDARRVKAMTPQQGGSGPRKRWRLSDERILEWDRQHGELEMYDKTGKKHLGSYHPDTGKQLKPPKANRNISKYVN